MRSHDSILWYDKCWAKYANLFVVFDICISYNFITNNDKFHWEIESMFSSIRLAGIDFTVVCFLVFVFQNNLLFDPLEFVISNQLYEFFLWFFKFIQIFNRFITFVVVVWSSSQYVNRMNKKKKKRTTILDTVI